MVYINGSFFAYSALQSIAEKKCSFSNLESWELNFWKFVKDWYSLKDYIETKTSGSTGEPKWIRHKKKYCLASAQTTCKFFKLKKGDKALLCLPMTSIGGKMMFIRSMLFELELHVLKPNSNPLKELNFEIQFAAMVPLQVNQVFEQNPNQWQFVHTLLIGGGRVHKALEENIIRAKINAYSSFGMTETISHIALKKIGKLQPYHAMDQVMLSINSENCLQISAAHLGIEKLQSQDIVELIDSSHFYWLGRRDRAIESGGFKFLPSVLEQKISPLIDLPFFISSMLHKKLNNQIVLVVKSNKPMISIEELKQVLDTYELPRKIFFTQEFIYLHSGKIDKKATLDMLSQQD